MTPLQLMSSNLAPSTHTRLIILSEINVVLGFLCVVDMEFVFFFSSKYILFLKKPLFSCLVCGTNHKNKKTSLANPEHKGTRGIWPKLLSYL